ncbi:MAG: Crp/Fnr family transcriptional regulator [Lachnospiraceae bacterium]|nr:Crp/Fnr family transcriptional regulator [Lachnospiraceae bacterium]
MKEYIKDLADTNLFSGITPNEISGLLDCVHAKLVDYEKDEFILEEGNRTYDFGIILSGRARAIKWDSTDRVIIITLLQKGSEIGVILAASLDHKSPVSVQAQEKVSILLIPFDYLLARCKKSCPCHERLLRNYINIVAEKGLLLHERMNCLLKPTVREKIMTYLMRVSCEKQSLDFVLPFNRNGMAEYLNVERSALSRELSNMKKDKVIDYNKNSFRLL